MNTAIKTHLDERKSHQVHKSSRALLEKKESEELEENEHPCCDIITTNFYLFYNFQIIFLLLRQSMGWLFVVVCYFFFNFLANITFFMVHSTSRRQGWNLRKARSSSSIFAASLTKRQRRREQLMMYKNHARLMINRFLQLDTMLQFTNCKVQQNASRSFEKRSPTSC